MNVVGFEILVRTPVPELHPQVTPSQGHQIPFCYGDPANYAKYQT